MHQNQNTWVNYRKEPIDLETIIDLSVKLAKSPVWTKYLRTSKIVALFLGPITISLTGLFNKENGISIKDFMLDRKPTLKCSDAPKSFIYSVYSSCFSLQKASCSELPMIRHSFSSEKKDVLYSAANAYTANSKRSSNGKRLSLLSICFGDNRIRFRSRNNIHGSGRGYRRAQPCLPISYSRWLRTDCIFPMHHRYMRRSSSPCCCKPR